MKIYFKILFFLIFLLIYSESNSQNSIPLSTETTKVDKTESSTPNDTSKTPANLVLSNEKTIVLVTPENDSTNYLSDEIVFRFDTYVTKIDMTKSEKIFSDGCAPANTHLKGIGKAKVKGDTVLHPLFRVTKRVGEVKPSAGHCQKDFTLVQEGDLVVVDEVNIATTPPDRYGWAFGTLLVPFKYQFKGDKNFSGGATLGGYAGFRFDRTSVLGLALQGIVFAGGSNIQVNQTVNGKITSQNMLGISYGLGLLGTIKDSFHLGIVLGADRVNDSANYQNNGKPWIAISLGFQFSK